MGDLAYHLSLPFCGSLLVRAMRSVELSDFVQRLGLPFFLFREMWFIDCCSFVLSTSWNSFSLYMPHMSLCLLLAKNVSCTVGDVA